MSRIRINEVGNTYGRLTVVKFAGILKWNCAFWHCRCSCGGKAIVCGAFLRQGVTKSCGCLWQETRIKNGLAAKTHGDTINRKATPEWRAWKDMLSRCYNPNNKWYRRYGGRGIKVCKRWRDDYKNFLADIGRKPTPLHSLDRINNNGNYTPSNCRWATKKEQANNRG